MTRGAVSVAMAVLALVTLAVAIITGVTSAISTSPGLDEANFVSHHWANVVSLPSWGDDDTVTATTPHATPVTRARGDARPGYLLLGLTLAAAAVAGSVVAATGTWSVLIWAVFPDVALLLAIGSTTEPGQLPRHAVPVYNLLHAPALPLVLIAAAGMGPLHSYWLVAAVSWLAHISIDRGCGYGPRTPEGWQRA